MVDIPPAADTAPAPETIARVRRGRVHIVDFLRGIAILAVIAYHFCWDLDEFGFARLDLFADPFWLTARTAIAGSFLFIAGFSLVLATADGINWRRYWIRFARIVLCAVLVSAVTYWNYPGSGVFFGILHLIATATILGLVFLRVPAVLTALFAVVLFAIDYAPQPWLSADWLLWLGLGTQPVHAVDYTPLVPWLGFFLLGLAAARVAISSPWWPGIARWRMEDGLGTAIRFLGRHTLVIYLVHQPILFGLFFLWLYLAQ